MDLKHNINIHFKTLITINKECIKMVNYKDYQPENTSRVREDIEWSQTYNFHSTDTKNPRVLLIGDSICNGYHNNVRTLLEDTCNLSFWASSKCVTDPDYFRELDFILDGYKFDIISFNNGLHSLTTDLAEWENAYRAAVSFICDKLPNTKLYLTLSTPLMDAKLTAISAKLNEIVKSIANEKNLPIIDLFTPMDKRDRNTDWLDTYHFLPHAIEEQAEIIANTVKTELGERATSVGHAKTVTGPSGALD